MSQYVVQQRRKGFIALYVLHEITTRNIFSHEALEVWNTLLGM